MKDVTHFSENLRKLMLDKKLTETDLAKICNVKQPSVHAWLTSGSISKTNLTKLCKHFGIALDDMMYGGAGNSSYLPTKRIPLISWVQAGKWRENGNMNYDEYIPTDISIPDECFALRVNGDSMTSQTGGRSIPDGAIVIVKPCELPPEDLNHKVVIAVNDDGETVMKELVLDGSAAYLKPWNTTIYSVIPVTKTTRIIGYVIRYQAEP